MLRVPRRYGHFVYGVIQSGLTCGIAAGIASLPLFATGAFLTNWLRAWPVAWITMLPIVLLAAPSIRRLTHFITSEFQRDRQADRADAAAGPTSKLR